MIPLAVESVTWIKVQRPTFDLVGVVLTSLGLAGICAGIALVLGTALGIGFILRRRRVPPRSWADQGLHLLDSSWGALAAHAPGPHRNTVRR